MSKSKSKVKEPDILQIKQHGHSAVLILTKEMRELGFDIGRHVKAMASAKEIVITPLKGVA